jgi:hypothetical protein
MEDIVTPPSPWRWMPLAGPPIHRLSRGDRLASPGSISRVLTGSVMIRFSDDHPAEWGTSIGASS